MMLAVPLWLAAAALLRAGAQPSAELASRAELALPDGAPESAHYAVDYLKAPAGEMLEIGGMDFLPDGRLVLSTRRGQVWIVEHPLAKDPSEARFTLFAEGLWEGLGLKVVEGAIVVLQRNEISRLSDLDGDGRCDEVRTLASGWGLTGNYHEFAYGLPRDAAGNLYFTLNVSFYDKTWWLGSSDAAHRGWALRMTPAGVIEPLAAGFRSPCGVSLSPHDELFVTDNQGDWEPACPVHHVRAGRFYGHPAGLAWTADYRASGTQPSQTVPPPTERTPPALWLPYKWSRSTGNVVWDTTGGAFGPFGGQMLLSELTNGMVLRASLEKVRGEYQGACFLFRQRVGSAVRALFASDGTLLIGMTNRGWGGFPPASGVARIRYTGALPFEMESVRVREDGFTVAFTEPLAEGAALAPENAYLTRYHYDYWWQYGSPERETAQVPVERIELAPDRRSLRLVVPGIEAGSVYRGLFSGLRSATGQPLLHEEFNYTLNQLPGGPPAAQPVARAVPPPTGRDTDEPGWLRLCWYDATQLWKHAGWKLVDAEYDLDNPSRFQVWDGNSALLNVGPEPVGDFESLPHFGDVQIHADFKLAEGAQARLYLLGRYAIRINADTPATRPSELDCGALVGGPALAARAPRVRAYKGGGQKHELEATLRAPRFDAAGAKIENARLVRLTIDENPLLEDVELTGPSEGASSPEAARGPIAFRVLAGQMSLAGIRAKPLEAAADAPLGEGWKLLFDGESLAGFEQRGASEWTIEDGVLTSGGKPGWLATERADYRDFELEAKLKLNEGGDSGIGLRCEPTEAGLRGIEAEINASFPQPERTGSLMGIAPLRVQLLPADTWFTYRMRVREESGGTRVTLWVNGIEINEALLSGERPAAGRIALEQHHEGSRVEFAEIKIRELR